MWKVMCRITGGTTGTRERELKTKDGVPERFTEREAAERRADELTHKACNNPYRTAEFRYWAEKAA